MAWFRRKPEETAGTPKKVNIAEGLWIKCDSCKEIMYRAEVERAGRVCPKCRYPFRIGARERIALLTDPGTFEELRLDTARRLVVSTVVVCRPNVDIATLSTWACSRASRTGRRKS